MMDVAGGHGVVFCSDEALDSYREPQLQPNKVGNRMDPTRDGHGNFTADPKSAVLSAQALELRAKSATYRAIAAALGVSVSSAYEAVQRGLRETMQEPADDLRRLELEKLDALERGALEVIAANPHIVSAGTVTPQADEGLKLQALTTLLRVSESRRKLLGLDSAAKVTLDGGVRYEVVGVDADKLT